MQTSALKCILPLGIKVWVSGIWLRVCAIRVSVILLRTMLLFLDCLLLSFDIFELSTYTQRPSIIFRTVHYPLKIMFDITLWCPTLLLIINFSSEVRIFNFSDNFPSAFKLSDFSQNFPTSAKLSNFRRNFSTSGSF